MYCKRHLVKKLEKNLFNAYRYWCLITEDMSKPSSSIWVELGAKKLMDVTGRGDGHMSHHTFFHRRILQIRFSIYKFESDLSSRGRERKICWKITMCRQSPQVTHREFAYHSWWDKLFWWIESEQVFYLRNRMKATQWGKPQLFIQKFTRIVGWKMWILWKNETLVNFVKNENLKLLILWKNEALKMWIFSKMRFSKCDFSQKWDF